jgi:hypothetical protein
MAWPASNTQGRDPIRLMLCWKIIRLILLGILLDVVSGATQDAEDLRVISLGSKAAALFLNFGKCF